MSMADDAMAALQSGAAGMAQGAALGSIVPGIGTAIGGAAGGLIGVAINAVPGLQHLVAGNADTIAKAESVVRSVTGTNDPAQAQAALDSDPDGIKADLQRQLAEIANDQFKAALADVANARQRDIQIQTISGGRNVRADVMLGLTVVGIVGSLMVAILGKLDGNSAIFGLVAGLVGLFSKCYADAFSFEFGSSRGSATKDNTISDIARNGIPVEALPKPLAITSGK